jgi:acetoin utilization protein AcuC
MQLLEEKKVYENPDVVFHESKPATNDELLLTHKMEYLIEVETKSYSSTPLSPDTPVNPSIVEAARYIVGGGLKAAQLVSDGYGLVDAVGGGLHHAGPDYGGGFCVFNDVAVCATYLLENQGYDRVLVFDTDVHAGNGTMDIFYHDPRVLFIDIHQDPRTLYPGRGFLHEIGDGAGKGYTVNVTLPPFSGDHEYEMALSKVFRPLVKQFEPQVIIRNGGSDPHFSDGLGNLNLTYRGLHRIGESVREVASEMNIPIINMSCSGYNPDTVAEGWYAIFTGLMGTQLEIAESVQPEYVYPKEIEVLGIIEELAVKLEDYWAL